MNAVCLETSTGRYNSRQQILQSKLSKAQMILFSGLILENVFKHFVFQGTETAASITHGALKKEAMVTNTTEFSTR